MDGLLINLEAQLTLAISDHEGQKFERLIFPKY